MFLYQRGKKFGIIPDSEKFRGILNKRNTGIEDSGIFGMGLEYSLIGGYIPHSQSSLF